MPRTLISRKPKIWHNLMMHADWRTVVEMSALQSTLDLNHVANSIDKQLIREPLNI
jgi:hypothetical protein